MFGDCTIPKGAHKLIGLLMECLILGVILEYMVSASLAVCVGGEAVAAVCMLSWIYNKGDC